MDAVCLQTLVGPWRVLRIFPLPLPDGRRPWGFGRAGGGGSQGLRFSCTVGRRAAPARV